MFPRLQTMQSGDAASRAAATRERTLGSLTGSLETKTDALVVAESSLAGRLLLGGSGEPAGMEGKRKKEPGVSLFLCPACSFVFSRHRTQARNGKKIRRNVKPPVCRRRTRRKGIPITRVHSPGVDAELLLVSFLSLRWGGGERHKESALAL